MVSSRSHAVCEHDDVTRHIFCGTLLVLGESTVGIDKAAIFRMFTTKNGRVSAVPVRGTNAREAKINPSLPPLGKV